MTGNFFELGPYLVVSSLKHNVEHLTLKKNPSSRIGCLVFYFLIDNPIGTRFSIALTYEEIPCDHQNVVKHLSIAIKKFISLNTFF